MDQNSNRKLIGIISDTHGLLRPQAIEALAGVDMILHAGDIGNQQVLDALNAIAPVVAVRGNNDKGDWAQVLPDLEVIEWVRYQYTCCTMSKRSTSVHPEPAFKW